jgi:O-antigen/teichoic acid export membrane protein
MGTAVMITPAAAGRESQSRWGARRYAKVAFRYGLSSFGPIAISGAHFFASILFLRALSRVEFGLLSFLFVVVPLCLSISGALVGASVSRVAARANGLRDAEIATHLKVNLFFSLAAGACVFALLRLGHSDIKLALVLGCYAGLMTLRWFGRNVGYALRTPMRVALSDSVYAASLVGGLGVLYALHGLDAGRAADVLLLAAAAGLAALGKDFMRHLLWPARDGSLLAFGGIWRDLARWSVLGVFLTELTANAHVYLVTFAFGPASFALLAVGSLLMRPVVLVLSALPDLERPEMGRRIAAGDKLGALSSVKEFRTAAGAVWLATLLLAGVVLMWFPHLVLKHGYDVGQVLIVLAFWGAITAVRVARTPESVLLQAAGEFRALAAASGWSSLASMAVTLLLMLAFGPVASLGGILIGELVMTSRIFALSGRWKLAHA